jgi:hypothetical protein
MAQRANQHYVPQFYFRYFSQNGKSICVLNRNNGLTIKSASIKDQASKNYFYGDEKIEQTLSEMEKLFSSALRQIKEDLCFEKCTPENYALFLQNISHQRSRTMKAIKSNKPMRDKLAQLYVECMVNNNDHLLNDETKDMFLNNIQLAEANPQEWQSMYMNIAIENAGSLCDLLPVILKNKTNRPFIFGDAPVIFINPYLKNITSQGVLGTQSSGLIILYPIGSTHSIMLIDERAYRIKKLRGSVLAVRDLKDVAALNKLQIHNASSAVYFSDNQYSQYVANLWMQEKRKLVEHQCKIIEASGFYHDGKPIDEILQFFELQLPFIPKLSFLEYQELPENDYKFSPRIAWRNRK